MHKSLSKIVNKTPFGDKANNLSTFSMMLNMLVPQHSLHYQGW